MKMEIGKNIKQKDGFSAFIPAPFPPQGLFQLSSKLLLKSAKADRLIGKLDGITQTLPDLDFFLKMFVIKDATSSAQIEGTKATMLEAIEHGADIITNDTDADDIIHYVDALNYSINRLSTLPLSLRFVREIHRKLMTKARSSHFSDPGEFRKTQNWIGGTTPENALFVPPPVSEMKRALSDLEKFLHDNDDILPLLYIGIAHAQFETIHPFLDGNGRTGRLLISMLLYSQEMLEKPVLFLSSYFKKHQKTYYQRLNEYHDGLVEHWLDFFLDGIIHTANSSIKISKSITKLRDLDMIKVQSMGKRESQSGALVLEKLYAQPIISSKTIMEWTGFSRPGAQKLIERFIEHDILQLRNREEAYDRSYIYKKYFDVFVK